MGSSIVSLARVRPALVRLAFLGCFTQVLFHHRYVPVPFAASIGPVPKYLGSLACLQELDLSDNKLDGKIRAMVHVREM